MTDLSGRSKALLREQHLADEPGGVVGEDERRLGVIGNDHLGGAQSALRLLPIGASAVDPLETMSGQELVDLPSALRPPSHLSSLPRVPPVRRRSALPAPAAARRSRRRTGHPTRLDAPNDRS